MDSILTSIKKLLGITEECKHFDTDIIVHINTVFLTLQQIGVGPKTGFNISDEYATWDSYLPENDPSFEAVKSYVYLRVRLLFDPPTQSSLMDSITRQISELEWRLNVEAETPTREKEGE